MLGYVPNLIELNASTSLALCCAGGHVSCKGESIARGCNASGCGLCFAYVQSLLCTGRGYRVAYYAACLLEVNYLIVRISFAIGCVCVFTQDHGSVAIMQALCGGDICCWASRCVLLNCMLR